MPLIPQKADAAPRGAVISETGQVLSRSTAFRFALDPTQDQDQLFRSHAGAARYVFNHHVARVKSNLDVRAAEAEANVADADRTPALSWSGVSFINAFTQFKNGQLGSSPVNDDGSVGLHWADQVSVDAFECASVNAAQALANFSSSRSGERKGKKVGFPKFKSRHETNPTFSLRSRYKPTGPAAIRIVGPKAVLLPKIGTVRVHGSTKRVRRLVEAGRFRILKATVTFERGKWWVSLQVIAAVFNRERRSATGRHDKNAGLDAGIKTLAVVADTEGVVLRVVPGVKALQHALQALKRANKTHARTKQGSKGRRKAKERLVKMHARIAWLRETVAHNLTAWCTATFTQLTIEDLNIAGMLQLRNLARSLSDAGMGQVLSQLEYKAGWYGTELVVASRWFASSKTCSECGNVKADLTLSDRTYDCAVCGLSIDRDVNAAINLARWVAPAPKAQVQKKKVVRKRVVPKAVLLVA